MRVLGVDPGLTRCGLGVVDGGPGAPLRLVAHRRSCRTPGRRGHRQPAAGHRRSRSRSGCAEYQPDAVAVERVFSQHNVRTVMGTAQAGAVAIVCAARRGHAGGPAHPERGQGGGDRQRPGRQGAGHRDGDPAAPADGPAAARRRRRRARAGDLPSVARRRPGEAGGPARRAATERQPGTRVGTAAERAAQREDTDDRASGRRGDGGRARTARSSRSAASGCSCSARRARWPGCGRASGRRVAHRRWSSARTR